MSFRSVDNRRSPFAYDGPHFPLISARRSIGAPDRSRVSYASVSVARLGLGRLRPNPIHAASWGNPDARPGSRLILTLASYRISDEKSRCHSSNCGHHPPVIGADPGRSSRQQNCPAPGYRRCSGGRHASHQSVASPRASKALVPTNEFADIRYLRREAHTRASFAAIHS